MTTSTDTRACIGVVLAGGQSQRMGRDKALLDWHGRPLIEHQLATLQAAGVTRACVSGLRPDYHGIADPLVAAGPVAGLAGVANDIADDADLLVVPVDMPLLSPSLLARLRTENLPARCLTLGAHVLPFRLRLDRATRALLSQLLATGNPRQRSLRALQHTVGI
ncbi:MAG TPA: molybdenum cofactor guanylyltransferase, partial [Oleiagrimonas sp.]|nr:molybdenum cofactor guanylyltransferase [Oleiagrimonas sp.]